MYKIVHPQIFLILTTGADNWLRTITSDRIVYDCTSLSFPLELAGITSLDRNYWDVINLLFISPGLYLNTLKTERILQFWDEKILDVRGTSFQVQDVKNQLIEILPNAVHPVYDFNNSFKGRTKKE